MYIMISLTCGGLKFTCISCYLYLAVVLSLHVHVYQNIVYAYETGYLYSNILSQLTAAGPRGTSGSRAVSRVGTATRRACAHAQAPNLHTVGTTVRERSKRTATAVNRLVLRQVQV